jgi:hypothetical protein
MNTKNKNSSLPQDETAIWFAILFSVIVFLLVDYSLDVLIVCIGFIGIIKILFVKFWSKQQVALAKYDGEIGEISSALMQKGFFLKRKYKDVWIFNTRLLVQNFEVLIHREKKKYNVITYKSLLQELAEEIYELEILDKKPNVENKRDYNKI